MEVLLFFVLFWMLCEGLALLGPVIFEGVSYLIGITVYGIWLVLRWISLGLWALFCEYILPLIEAGYCAARDWLARQYHRFVIWAKDRVLLLGLVIRELIHPTPDEEFEEEEDDEEDGSDAAAQAFAAACERLGLGEPFTQADLKAAYRRAIAIAHPDRGGSTEASQQVSEDRARIARHMGWDT